METEVTKVKPVQKVDKDTIYFGGHFWWSRQYVAKLLGISPIAVSKRAQKENWKKLKIKNVYYLGVQVLKSVGLL